MEDLPVFKTAFAGYRFLAARPAVLFWWFALAICLVFVQIFAVVEMAGPQLAALQDMRSSGAMDPASAAAINRGMMGYNLFGMLFPWVTGAITLGAATRAALSPNPSSFGYLRFGSDEFRLLITTFVLTVISFLAAAVMIIMGLVVMFSMGGREALMTMRTTHQFPTTILGPFALGCLPGLIFLVFLSVKLSLAAADTVNGRSINIFGSWTLTRNRFWKILAIYILGALPAVALIAVGSALTFAGSSGDLMNRVMGMQAGLTSLSAAFEPQKLASYVISALGRVAVMAGLLFPAAQIFAAVNPDDTSVFDDEDDDDDDQV